MAEDGGRHDQATARYEAEADGQVVAYTEYRLEGSTAVFLHTVVEPGHEGQGIGSQLIRGALDDVRRRELTVVPRCPFVARFIMDHTDYRDLLAPGWEERT